MIFYLRRILLFLLLSFIFILMACTNSADILPTATYSITNTPTLLVEPAIPTTTARPPVAAPEGISEAQEHDLTIAFGNTFSNTLANQPDDSLLGEQLLSLAETAEKLRGLETLEAITFEVMSGDALLVELQAQLSEDYPEERLRAEQQMLKLLGLIPPAADLEALYLQLYGSEIAGYYEPDANTFFLIREQALTEPLPLMERITFFHEYIHALQDQHFNLLHYTDKEVQQTRNYDQNRAYQALIEGDAQWSTLLYLANALTIEEIEQLAEVNDEIGNEMDDMPPFLRDSLIFPYVEGQLFVQEFQQTFGWESVNEMWFQVPVSTEQILHPEKYPYDMPTEVNLPTGLAEALGDGWREALREVWGEFNLLLLLQQQPLNNIRPMQAAAGWDGDQYLYLIRGEQGVFVMEMVWDSRSDRAEGQTALLEWLRSSGFVATTPHHLEANKRFAYISSANNHLFFGLATDQGPLETVVTQLGWQ